MLVLEQVADARIKLVVSEANENALPDLLSDPPQLEDVLKSENPCTASVCNHFVMSLRRNNFYAEQNDGTVARVAGLIICSNTSNNLNVRNL